MEQVLLQSEVPKGDVEGLDFGRINIGVEGSVVGSGAGSGGEISTEVAYTGGNETTGGL